MFPAGSRHCAPGEGNAGQGLSMQHAALIDGTVWGSTLHTLRLDVAAPLCAGTVHRSGGRRHLVVPHLCTLVPSATGTVLRIITGCCIV